MDDFLNNIACAGTECLSWILVFLNIMAVFYLVFCSFWRVTKLVKIVGWVWIGVLCSATIGVLIFHTCIYTLLVTVFTVMMFMAILSVILPQEKDVSLRKKAEITCQPVVLPEKPKKTELTSDVPLRKSPCPLSDIPRNKAITIQPCGARVICTNPCPKTSQKETEEKKMTQSSNASLAAEKTQSPVSVKKNRDDFCGWLLLLSATVLTTACVANLVCARKRKKNTLQIDIVKTYKKK